MLDLLGKLLRDRGASRRDFLHAGAAALGSVSLPQLLHGQSRSRPGRRDSAVIEVVLSGGPSQLDTFDPKPGAPAEVRGPYRAIRTNVPGIDLAERFPLLARQMDRFSVLRAVSHQTLNHLAAEHYQLTGHRPAGEHPLVSERPAAGAVAARFRGARAPGVPAYVCVPRFLPCGHAAYLGASFDPFEVTDPNHEEYGERSLHLPLNLDRRKVASLRALRASCSFLRRPGDATATDARAIARARAALTSRATRQAADIDRERAEVRDRYGRTGIGQACLLARRLVEAGTTFVAVEDHGWDMHSHLRQRVDDKAAALDRALATLAADLTERGLLGRVLLVVHGEFGRAPRLNRAGGRDDWSGVYSVLLGGGGLRGGQVVGASSARGDAPRDRPLRPEDVLATVYHVLGIDPRQRVRDERGRLRPLLDRGTPVRELI